MLRERLKKFVGETLIAQHKTGRYFVGYCGSQPAYDDDFEEVELDIENIEVDYEYECIVLTLGDYLAGASKVFEIDFTDFKNLLDITLKDLQKWLDDNFIFDDWYNELGRDYVD